MKRYRKSLEDKLIDYGMYVSGKSSHATQDILRYIRGYTVGKERGNQGCPRIPNRKGFNTIKDYDAFEDLLRQVRDQKVLALTSSSPYIRQLAQHISENNDDCWDWKQWLCDMIESNGKV